MNDSKTQALPSELTKQLSDHLINIEKVLPELKNENEVQSLSGKITQLRGLVNSWETLNCSPDGINLLEKTIYNLEFIGNPSIYKSLNYEAFVNCIEVVSKNIERIENIMVDISVITPQNICKFYVWLFFGFERIKFHEIFPEAAKIFLSFIRDWDKPIYENMIKKSIAENLCEGLSTIIFAYIKDILKTSWREYAIKACQPEFLQSQAFKQDSSVILDENIYALCIWLNLYMSHQNDKTKPRPPPLSSEAKKDFLSLIENLTPERFKQVSGMKGKGPEKLILVTYNDVNEELEKYKKIEPELKSLSQPNIPRLKMPSSSNNKNKSPKKDNFSSNSNRTSQGNLSPFPSKFFITPKTPPGSSQQTPVGSARPLTPGSQDQPPSDVPETSNPNPNSIPTTPKV